MSLKKYEAFVRTVELGSLTKAAQSLGSTQSRISHILNDLEEEYGFRLMHRSRGGIELTEAGQLLLPKMKAIVQKAQELSECVSEIRSADAVQCKVDVIQKNPLRPILCRRGKFYAKAIISPRY